jgi:hypothetical protein
MGGLLQARRGAGLTEVALSAAGALWSPLRQNVEKRYFEAMVGFTQPFFITPCDGRKLR